MHFVHGAQRHGRIIAVRRKVEGKLQKAGRECLAAFAADERRHAVERLGDTLARLRNLRLHGAAGDLFAQAAGEMVVSADASLERLDHGHGAHHVAVAGEVAGVGICHTNGSGLALVDRAQPIAGHVRQAGAVRDQTGVERSKVLHPLRVADRVERADGLLRLSLAGERPRRDEAGHHLVELAAQRGERLDGFARLGEPLGAQGHHRLGDEGHLVARIGLQQLLAELGGLRDVARGDIEEDGGIEQLVILRVLGERGGIKASGCGEVLVEVGVARGEIVARQRAEAERLDGVDLLGERRRLVAVGRSMGGGHRKGERGDEAERCRKTLIHVRSLPSESHESAARIRRGRRPGGSPPQAQLGGERMRRHFQRRNQAL